MKKRVLGVLLVVIMIIGILPVTASSKIIDSGKCGENVYWSVDSTGTLTISGTGDMDNYFLSGAPWSKYNKALINVVIEEGVTSIGGYAFYLCEMESVQIPKSVKNIGNNAFDRCNKLKSVVIPSVINIGGAAFCRCTNLTSVELGYGVKVIGFAAFLECGNLKSVTFPESLTTIEGNAFNFCSSLTNITFPNSLTSVDGFSYCNGITSVTIQGGVKTIGDGTFSSCDGLKEVLIMDGVTEIKENAFGGCRNLKSIVIPESVKIIDYEVFGNAFSIAPVENIYYGGTEMEWRIITNGGGLRGVEPKIYYNMKSLAQMPVFVNLNGKQLEFDQWPVIDNGRTLVPVRAIFEAMGMTVAWDSNTSTVTATGNGNQIQLRINDANAVVNGKTYTLDVPAKIIGGRTLVPVRFIAESLGAKVNWNAESRIVDINL